MQKFENHTFVISAYQESKYLEECIQSLQKQTIQSNIILCTSTPNQYIKSAIDKYQIKLVIRSGKSGIGQDWNFGVKEAKTDYVTIAHQDDRYDPKYLENIVEKLKKGKDFIIAFTDYREIKKGERVPMNSNLWIKKILLFPLRLLGKTKLAKQFALCFGNAICCPSVTVNKKLTGDSPYQEALKCDLDWDTWYTLSKKKGRFLYLPKELMEHRIHEESETTALIENNIRIEEDLMMLKKFWPDCIAKKVMKLYHKSITTNQVN